MQGLAGDVGGFRTCEIDARRRHIGADAEAARRELEEETGYRAGYMEALTHGPASSGLTSETVTFFLATKLSRVGKGVGVAHEDITLHEVPLSEVHGWLDLKAKAGVLIDPKVCVSLYFIGRRK